jgi:DNA-binding MarR family transcriptional regulator
VVREWLHTNRKDEVDAGDEERLSSVVFHLGRELRTALDRRLEAHGLTSQQAGLLLLSRLLREPNPIRMAARLGTDTAGMTRLIDRLESKGLVARKISPDDRRSIVVVLGPKSKHVLPRLIPTFQTVETGLLDGFDAKEVRMLNSMLRRMLKNTRKLNRQDLG